MEEEILHKAAMASDTYHHVPITLSAAPQNHCVPRAVLGLAQDLPRALVPAVVGGL